MRQEKGLCRLVDRSVALDTTAGGQVYADDESEEADVEDEPHVDMLEVGCAGQRRTCIRVERDEHQQRCQAHGALVVELVHRQVQRQISVTE